ncbi:MAG: ferritin-like domain-containing protein [Polyangiaceae bacterium]|nr:ferritin-like domain-containing protein [Polyangiaceae bacterium]
MNITDVVSEIATPSASGSTSSVKMPLPPTGTDTVPVAYDTIYTWDYGAKRQDLRTLYEKSKEGMWNARTDLAWDTNVDPEFENVPDQMSPIYGTPLWDKLDKKTELPKLRQLACSYLLSNFLHGEQGALFAASQIVSIVPGTDAKLYAATQVMDEARHVEAYDRYLREKIEVTFPISPYLRTLLDEILQERRWDLKYLGMQIMVEGLALAAFGFLGQVSREPLLRSLIHNIMLDEARHVAFGVLALKGIYEEMSESELRDREDFIVDASRLMRDRFLMQEVWECMGMPVEECTDLALKSESMQLFRSMLFSKIVPNVKRLGLLTPRVRKGFEELGVIQYESWDATA